MKSSNLFLVLICLCLAACQQRQTNDDTIPNPMQEILDQLSVEELAFVEQVSGVWIPDSFAIKGVEDPENLQFNIQAMMFRPDLSYEVVAPEGMKNEQGQWSVRLPDSLFMREKDQPVDISGYRVVAVRDTFLILELSDRDGFLLEMFLNKLPIEN